MNMKKIPIIGAIPPLNLGLLHLWSKFGDPSLNGWWVIEWTSSWLTHTQTDGRTHRQTDAGNNNTRRTKLASGKNLALKPVVKVTGKITQINYELADSYWSVHPFLEYSYFKILPWIFKKSCFEDSGLGYSYSVLVVFEYCISSTRNRTRMLPSDSTHTCGQVLRYSDEYWPQYWY